MCALNLTRLSASDISPKDVGTILLCMKETRWVKSSMWSTRCDAPWFGYRSGTCRERQGPTPSALQPGDGFALVGSLTNMFDFSQHVASGTHRLIMNPTTGTP